MNTFCDTVKQKLKYYVYALIDPRNNGIFYIGKGVNDRVFEHEKEKQGGIEGSKHRRINDIKASGNEVKKNIVLHGLTEAEAFAAEAALINLMEYLTPDNLTNVVSGHHADPVMTVDEIERFYGAEMLTDKDIYHNLLVIKINSLYNYNMSEQDIMDCARGHWIINTNNAKKVDYLVAVYHGIVVGVYEGMKWYPSGVQTEFYPRPCEENLKLIKRKYCTCTPVSQSKYLNTNLSMLVRDTQNPISYIWGRKNSTEKLKPYYEMFCGMSEKDMRSFEDDFGNDMKNMGFEMDDFTRYKKSGNPEEILACNDYLKVKDTIKDLDYLTVTSMLFSKWRYLTHWAYMDYCRYDDDIEFFRATLEKIFSLCN